MKKYYIDSFSETRLYDSDIVVYKEDDVKKLIRGNKKLKGRKVIKEDKMKKNELKIYYQCEKPNREMDKKLQEVVESFGYKWWAEGYNLVDHVRDIAFDLEEK